MENDFALTALNMQKKQMITELVKCNETSGQYGLTLTENQIGGLVAHRFETLHNTGRVEFGGGILKQLIEKFCTSPFILQEDYEYTLSALQESFYYFKNECEDNIYDEDLIDYMRIYFDDACRGSIEKLDGATLGELLECAKKRFNH